MVIWKKKEEKKRKKRQTDRTGQTRKTLGLGGAYRRSKEKGSLCRVQKAYPRRLLIPKVSSYFSALGMARVLAKELL